MSASSLECAIFDFDGTLVDTMPLHYEAYRRSFFEAGVELTHADFFDNVGGNARETIPLFLRDRPCRRSIADLHSRKQQLVKEIFSTANIQTLAVSALLPLLHGRVRMALASSGSRPGIEVLLARLQWTAYFDVIVTGEDATSGKPAPDLFLLASKKLSVPPAQCLVFEDTDAGIDAAVAAGMRCYDVRSRTALAPPVRRDRDGDH